jgi:hypothetical protein
VDFYLKLLYSINGGYPTEASFSTRSCVNGMIGLPITHCYENPIYVFLFWELRGLSPNFHIHVSVSYSYIPRIGPHICPASNGQTNPGNI